MVLLQRTQEEGESLYELETGNLDLNTCLVVFHLKKKVGPRIRLKWEIQIFGLCERWFSG